MRIFANKKHLYSLAVGCAVFLCIGIRVQNAKAIEPSAEWMEGYWKDNPEIFQKTFEELFQKADSLNPLLDSLPNAFTTGRENFCTTYTIKNVCETGSCTEALARLEQDVSLKEILKVFGSREFLARILTHAAVDCIPPRDAQEDAETEIQFTPYFRESFFNTAGKGKLRMTLRHTKHIRCDFEFAFEKQEDVVTMTEYRACYQDSAREQTKEAEWFSKPKPLSDFPLDAVKEAKRKIPEVYAGLRDAFAAGHKKLADCKICPEVSDGVSMFMLACRFAEEKYASSKEKDPHVNEEPFIPNEKHMALDPINAINIEDFTEIISRKQFLDRQDNEGQACHFSEEKHASLEEKCSYAGEKPFTPNEKHTALLDIVKTEDFMEGIFGKQFLNILRHANEGSLSEEGLRVSFQIYPFPEHEYSLVEFWLQNTRVGCRNTEYCSYQKNKRSRFDFNSIKFFLLFNAEKNEILFVQCVDKLVLNYQLIQKSDELDMPLILDEDDQDK